MLGRSPSTVQCMYTRCFLKTSVGDGLGMVPAPPRILPFSHKGVEQTERLLAK
jgi:hypothetical protein